MRRRDYDKSLADSSRYLALEPDDDAMVQLQGHSINYCIAVGPQQGRKVFALQTLHTGVSAVVHQRDKLWNGSVTTYPGLRCQRIAWHRL